MMLRRLIEASRATQMPVEHSVICLAEIGAHGEVLKRKGVVVHALGMGAWQTFFKQFIRLLKLLRRANPHLVQTWMVHADLVGGMAARLARVPRLIWGVRTTDYGVESRNTRAFRWLCARLSSVLPDKIVCAAHASFDSSVAAGYDNRKLMVIYNGFDVGELRAFVGKGLRVREEARFPSDSVVIGCVGRYNPAKDHATFVRAAGLLAARHANCRFLMVGRELEPSNFALMKLIDATGFTDRFALLGERSDPAACLDAMDIFVSSSCTEGFPNVIAEAMAMGVPCVSTDAGDAALLLGGTGAVVPVGDANALAVAVSRLASMPSAEREALGKRGLERVGQEFTISVAARRFTDLYSSLVGGR